MANSGTRIEPARETSRGGRSHALPELDRAGLAPPSFQDGNKPRIAALCDDALARYLADADFEQIRDLLAEMRKSRFMPKNFEPVAAWYDFVCHYHDVQLNCKSWNEAIKNLDQRWQKRLDGRKTVKSVCPPVFEALTQAWRAVFNECCEEILEHVGGGSGQPPGEALSLFQDDVLAATVKICGLALPEGIEIEKAGQCARNALAQEPQGDGDIGRRLAQLKRGPIPPLVQLAELNEAVARRSAAEYSLRTLADVLRGLAPAAPDDSYALLLAERLDGLCEFAAGDESADLGAANEHAKRWLSALLAFPKAAADDEAASEMIQQLRSVAEEFEGARPHLEAAQQWLAAVKHAPGVAPDCDRTVANSQPLPAIGQLRIAVARLQEVVIRPLIGASASDSLADGLRNLRPSYSIFISHSSEDHHELEHAIVQPLCRAGFNVFYTSQKGTISPGADYVDAIDQALDECDCFIVAVTVNSAKSKNVRSEVEIANLLKKEPVVVIRLDQTHPHKIHQTLAVAQIIFFCDKRGQATPQTIQQGLGELLEFLAQKSRQPSSDGNSPQTWLEQLQRLADWDNRLTQQLASLRIAEAMVQALCGEVDQARAACREAELDQPCRDTVDQSITALGEVSKLRSQLGAAVGNGGALGEDWPLLAATADTSQVKALGAAAVAARDQLARVKLPHVHDAGAARGQLTALVDSCQRLTRFHDLWAETQLDIAGRDFSAAVKKAEQLAELSPAVKPLARALNELSGFAVQFSRQREAGDFDQAQEQLAHMRRSRDALDELGRQLLDECLAEWIATFQSQLDITGSAYEILQARALPSASEGQYRQALTALDEALALARGGDDGLGREGLTLPEINRWYEVVKALLDLQEKLEGEQREAAETTD